MLMTSFGASVGGMATPVGTPPNLIGIGMLERIAGIRISFFTWMAIGMPLVLVLFAALVTLFTVTTCAGRADGRGRRGSGADRAAASWARCRRPSATCCSPSARPCCCGRSRDFSRWPVWMALRSRGSIRRRCPKAWRR